MQRSRDSESRRPSQRLCPGNRLRSTDRPCSHWRSGIVVQMQRDERKDGGAARRKVSSDVRDSDAIARIPASAKQLSPGLDWLFMLAAGCSPQTLPILQAPRLFDCPSFLPKSLPQVQNEYRDFSRIVLPHPPASWTRLSTRTATTAKMSYRVGVSKHCFMRRKKLTRTELAKTGRSGCSNTSCKKAESKIQKGELRQGVLVQIQEHQSMKWRHWYFTALLFS